MNDALPARPACRGVKVSVPATTANLGPGYDVLGLALDVGNDVEVTLSPEGLGFSLNVRGEGADELGDPERNLLVRALRETLQAEGLGQLDVTIRQTNRIPLRRGLGSSAAAVVGGVAAGLALSRGVEGTTPAAVLELAVPYEGHPDNVVPALVGGLCLCWSSEGRHGTRYLQLDPPPGLGAVVCVPAVEVATAEARRVLPATVAHSDAVFSASRTALLVAALSQGRVDVLADAMEDRLHQPYRIALLPAMGGAIKAAVEAGAYGACLSGSGSSVLALCPDDDALRAPVGEAMVRCFAREGGARVFQLRPSLRGAQLAPIDTIDEEDEHHG